MSATGVARSQQDLAEVAAGGLRGLPGRLVLALVVLEGLGERAQHLGRGLEQCLELRLVDLADILAQLLLKAGKGMPHLLGEMRDVFGNRHELLQMWPRL